MMSNYADLQWLAEQGAKFALPKGRTKSEFPKGWQNEPYDLDTALAHAQRGGNIGILTGKHSANIIAIDRDVNFCETAEMLGELANTTKIVRTNGPGRGKFLYRINGEIPPTTAWKPEGAKHPEIEFLGDNGQRHALCPPSEYDEGQYILLDTHHGIMEITPAQVDHIWRMITGGSIFKETKAKEEAANAEFNKNDFVRKVKEAWTTTAIFAHFGIDSGGTELDQGETRILGNGGLLVMADDDRWYCHSETTGGDKVDAWSYCKWSRTVDRGNKQMFWDTINDMADAAGIEKPQAKKGKKLLSVADYVAQINEDEPLDAGATVVLNGERVKVAAYKGIVDGVPTYMIDGSSDPIPESELSVEIDDKPEGEHWVNAVRKLGYIFKLNVLEDTIETADGKRLDDMTRSRIYLAMKERKLPKTYVDDCINIIAGENAYHPIRDYLNSLQWDGQNHLGKLLSYITGDGKIVSYGEDTLPLHAALFTRWLLGCAARGLDGDANTAFKHQTPMLVIIGAQGLGKSSLIRWLASGVGFNFHRESPVDPHNNDHVRSAVTKWIWEISELGASLRKGDRDALKGFITQEWHTYRKSYGRDNITKPLLANFVGTINPEVGFLDDPTGHRRFLPIHLTAIDHSYEKNIDVDQVWAQLVRMYRNGQSPELASVEREALQSTYKEHEVENPLQTYLQMYFTIEPDNESRKCFTADIISRLQAFGVAIANNPKVAGREINDALAPLGGKRDKLSIDGVKGWGWRGIEPNNKRPQPRAQPHGAAVPSTDYAGDYAREQGT